ncbi:MAG: PAS domain-containing protein [Chlorobium limicola]|uniref:ATP-binding protein n=1 Tax=Chlorobium limicola TaxID=1092 RepID=UPI0023F22E37|nr:ATP-binding protein [Chlorobium limicola]NTV21509.1 PAS domain-containing protein [Chlorobium limicola]
MKRNALSEKPLLMLSPKYLAGLFSLLVFLFLGTAFFEYQYRKSEIEHIMREEAALLIHALRVGAENAITGYNENRSLLTGSLFDQLRLLDRLDMQKPLTSTDLSVIAGSSGVYRINVFDGNGRRIAFNTPPDHTPLEQTCDPRQMLLPLYSGKQDSLLLGIRPSTSDRGPRLIAAVRRSRGGVIAANIDASKLLDLRRRLGVGQLIQRIGADTTGIEYIIWQDSSAILSATPNVSKVDPVHADPFLLSAFRSTSAKTRMTTCKGKPVFEVVKPFYYNGINVGLLRIGLKTDHYDITAAKLRNRLFMLVGLVVIGSLFMFNLIVTRRSEAEMKHACERAQNFSSVILESMADVVVAVDAAGKITMINTPAEKLFRISLREVFGKYVNEVIPESAPFLDGIVSGRHAMLDREFHCSAGGRQLLLAGNFSLITGRDSRIEGAVAVLRDLTEQRAMQQVIDRQAKLQAMGELASGVAHEIRNPLNAIGILAQRLDIEFSPAADEPEYRHLVRTVVSEVHRLNAIIQRFLKFGRPPLLMPVPVHLADFVRSYGTVLQSEAEKKSIRFTLKADCDRTVLIDREQMQQVLLNIIRNGVEATAKGGSITIRVFCRGSRSVIEIADSGTGIPAAKLPEIFNLYFTTKNDGSGMGLSIANQIVHAHGGLIEVSSREGEGSVFSIVLPAL